MKRSLIAAINGNGPYVGRNEMLHVRGGEITELQGPNSDLVKYQNVLCGKCNNERSQRFDRAYDDFYNFVLANEKWIVARRVIDLMKVFQAEPFQFQTYLYKYFVKLFGCDLSANGLRVPRDLVLLLDQDRFVTNLRLYFTVNEDKLLVENVQDRSVGIGDMLTTRRNLESNDDPHYLWSTYFSFLHIHYLYDWAVQEPIGAAWTANSPYIYLGWITSLTAEQGENLGALCSAAHEAGSARVGIGVGRREYE